MQSPNPKAISPILPQIAAHHLSQLVFIWLASMPSRKEKEKNDVKEMLSRLMAKRKMADDNGYTCFNCEALIWTSCDVLIRHNTLDHPEMKVPCGICANVFPTFDLLEVHLKEKHAIEVVADTVKSAKQVGKGDIILINTEACKVTEVRSGKFKGRYQTRVTGVSIFSGETCVQSFGNHQSCVVPEVTTTQYILLNVSGDGDMTLFREDDGHVLHGLKIPVVLIGEFLSYMDMKKDTLVTVTRVKAEEKMSNYEALDVGLYRVASWEKNGLSMYCVDAGDAFGVLVEGIRRPSIPQLCAKVLAGLEEGKVVDVKLSKRGAVTDVIVRENEEQL